MVQNSPFRVALALILFVSQSVIAIEKCRTGCNGAPGLLRLIPGTTYQYDYDGKIDINLSSAEGQQTSTAVKSTVLLTQQADCSQVLRILDIQVIGPDGKKRTEIPDVEKPVLLNNNNGNLDEFICAEPEDTQNSLNIKRAIASLFQVNPDDKRSEIDIFGQCPTHFLKSQDGNIITVTKNKNLNRCAFRESITQNYITSSFNIHSGIRSSPILDSKFDSKQKIKDGVLISANVVENYLFVPFSVGQNGAKASIESKLTLTGTTKDNPSTKCQEPKSIIFEDPHPVNAQKSNVNLILKKVKDISEQIVLSVEDKTAVQFIDLVKLLRISTKADILSVYNQVVSGVGFTDKDGAKKIFLDAILLGGNGDTIEVAIELLKNKELGPLEEKQLYIGLSRARHVTESSIKTATDLLNRPNLPREAFLGIGSLAGRYCDRHNCADVNVVKNIIQKFLNKLGDLKAANRKEETDMIYVLKGLTNVGYLNDEIDSKFVSLAEDKKQPTRLRVATLEAFQAAPCRDKLRNSALKTLKDIQEDSEIRIKAYLVLTLCPNDKIGNAVKALLKDEQSYQVGGFISTHIKNLRSSTNPDKLIAKTYLGFIHTPSRFPIDPRKYSFNAEFSNSFDAFGISHNVEGNVIYSQDSFLPRSSNMNLTAEVFGQRFNFLEISARQENLDRIIEHYLGPQGVLRKATLQQNWDNTVKPISNIFKTFNDKLDKTLRDRRDVSKAQIDAISKKVQIRTNELDKNLDLDLSIKNFGTETLFINSFEITQKLSPQNIIDELVNKLNEGIDKLKNFEETFRSNILFLDAELSYPTSLGFPLRLGIEGASNIQIKTAGHVDVRQLFFKSSAEDINIKLSLIPSAAVTVTGRFSLMTPVLENGLKVASTLHTSSGGEVEVKSFKKGYGLDVKINFPVQQQELIGLKHDIIFQSRENGVSIQDQKLKFSQNKDFSICIDQLVDYIGLELCADINGPNLSGKKVPILQFPFSGDAKVSVRVERGKIDTFHYRREFFSSAEGKIGVTATVETLGPNNKKGVSVDVEAFLSPDKYIKATLISPIKNAEAEARLVSNPKEKLLTVYLKDENVLYSAKAGLQIEESSEKTIYKPIFEYTTPGSNSPQVSPVRIEGKVVAEKNGNNIKYTFDNIKLIVSDQKSISLIGNVGNEGHAYFADLTASEGQLSASVKGRLQIQHNLLKIHTQLKNTVNPVINFDLNGEFKKDKAAGLYSTSFQFVHGEDLNSKTNIITLINSWKNPKEAEVSTRNKFAYPLMKISGKFNLDKTPKSLNYDTHLQYSDIKLGSEMKLKINSKSVGDYQLELNVHGLKDKVELKSSRQVIGAYDSKIINALSMNGKKLEVSGKIKHHLKPNDLHLGVDLIIKTPNSKSVWKFNEGIKFNHREIALHLKLISGDKTLIDNLFHANKVGDANGHIKVHFKDTIYIIGHLKSQKGVGNAGITVEAKALKKSSKAEATFTIHKPTYNLHLTFYPVFNEDKNKKVIFSTENQCHGTILDSKSTLDLLGSKYALNTKASVSNFFNGKTDIDVDLNLPDGKCFVGKFHRVVSSKNNVWNSDNSLFLEQKKGKSSIGRKIVIKGISKDTNLDDGVIDVTLNIDVKDPSGSANVDTTVKRQKNGDQWKVDIGNKIVSSFLDNPIETTYVSEYKKLIGSYKLKSSAAKNARIQVFGKCNFEAQKDPISGELQVIATLPFDYLSSVSISESFSIKIPEKNDPWHIDLAGSLNTNAATSGIDIFSQHTLKVEGTENSASFKYHGDTSRPFKLILDTSGSYVIDKVKKDGTAKGDFRVELSGDRIVKGSGSLARLVSKEYKLESSLDLQSDPSYSHHVNLEATTNKNYDISSVATYVCNGKKYLLNSDFHLKEKEPKVDVKLTYPDGKVSQLNVDVQRPSDKRLLSNVKVISQLRDFLLEGSIDVNSESLDNFYVQVNANSPKLNINDILFKISHVPGDSGKTVNIEISSAKKNILSGSAVVSSREEQGKYIVEGSGNFKVENQEKTGNFKYISTSLTSGNNGEIGEQISFDASLGNKAIDAELKLTDKEFRYSNSYCEESKQCAHVEVDIRNSIDGISRYSNEIEITMDLRVLGIPNEFGLKAVTRREDWLLNHSVDVHFQNSANKYQYSVFIHPKEAGISLTTPYRIIALEANGEFPTSLLQNGGKAFGELAFYTDKKNKPNSKTFLTGVIDVDVKKRLLSADLTFNIIGLAKVSSIKYTNNLPTPGLVTSGKEELILDIYNEPEQKFVVTHIYSSQISKETFEVKESNSVHAYSSGWGVDITIQRDISIDPKGLAGSYKDTASIAIGSNKYDSSIEATVSPRGSYFFIKYLNRVLLEAKADVKVQKGLVNIDSHISGLFVKPIDSTLEIKNYNAVKLTHKIKSTENVQLFVHAALTPGQLAEVRAEYLNLKDKRELFHVSLQLDDKHFLKPTFDVKTKHLKEYSILIKGSVAEKVNETLLLIKESNRLLSDDWLIVLRKVGETIPNTNATQQFYDSEINKIRAEFDSDKNLKELEDSLRNMVSISAGFLSDVINTIGNVIQSTIISVKTAFSKTLETIHEQIVPRLTQLAEVIRNGLDEIYEDVLEVFFAYVAKAGEILKAIQPQLNAISSSFSEVFEEIGGFVHETYIKVRVAVIENLKHLKAELAASPIFTELKAQYQDFIRNGLPSQEVIVNTLKSFTGVLKEAILIPEFQNVIDLVEKYLEKKITNKPVDDVAELVVIGKTFVDALTKLVTALSQEALPDFSRSIRIPKFNFELLERLPSADGGLKISALDYLINEDTKPLLRYLLHLLWDPQEVLKSSIMTGAVNEAQIITFDGRFLYPQGECSYLVASDAVNGNFSVVATVGKGKIISLTLSDKHGSITVSEGKLLFNNDEVDYPFHKGGIHAYRHYSHVSAVSTLSGVEIECELEMVGCAVVVPRFYHGQLRGILGNGNNEPFDDFTLPNGKIVTSTAEFAKTYSIGPTESCSLLETPVDSSSKPDARCDKLFGSDSPLRLCAPFLSNKQAKRACENAVAIGHDDAFKAISVHYAYYCWKLHIPVSLPDEHSNPCTNSIAPKKVDEQFNVKLPGKAADIVLAVSTNKNNEATYKDYVKPLVGEIVKEYKSKGIDDINFHIIAFAGENQQPAHVTVHGKMTFQDNPPNLKFAENPKTQKWLTGCPELNRFIDVLRTMLHEVQITIGFDLLSETYTETIKYPFRVEALKSIIVIGNEPCEVSGLIGFFLRSSTISIKRGINLNVIMPIKHLKVKDAKTTKDVVGFNSNNVITLTNAKDKPTGSPSLQKDLTYNNLCIDFVLNVGGNVFPTDNFVSNKNSRPQILHTVAQNIVSQAFSKKVELQCTCEYSYNNPFLPYNRCTVLEAKEQ